MQEATPADVAELASALTDDVAFENHVTSQLREAMTEALYMSGAVQDILGDDATLTPEQEEILVSVASDGMFEALASCSADDIDQ